MTQSKSLLAVKKKHFDLTKSFHTNFDKVTQLQKQAIQEILPALTLELDLQEEGKSRAKAFLDDLGTIFRFYRRSRYNSDAALSLLTSTLLWRLRTDLDLLSLSTLHPLYVSPPSPENPPLFWLNSKFKDKYNRPCGLISLRSLERTQERTLDEVKEYIVASMEITRRFLAHEFSGFLKKRFENGFDPTLELNQDLDEDDSEEDSKWIESSAPIQMTIAFDLAGSGMANLELELLPFLLDLLKNHFPGMVGAVYVLNYGWVHSGMWAVAKRVLPEQALAKIFFPNNTELRQHFHPQNLPVELGGDDETKIDSESADISKKFGRRRRFFNGIQTQTPSDSPLFEKKSLSRNPSYENIYDVFYSAAGTPWASRPASPRGSGKSTPRRDTDSPSTSTFPLANPNQLQMTPSADRKLRHLQMTRGSGDLSLTAEINDRNKYSEISPSQSPRRSRANSSAAGGAQINNRHVRFTPSNFDSNPAPSPPASVLTTPNRRIGNIRDFRFYLPQSNEDEILHMQDSESEAESDQSGKAGEKRVSPVEEFKGQAAIGDPSDPENAPTFFARLRRASRSSFSAMTGSSYSSDHLNGSGKSSAVPDEEKSYRIRLRDQQALQSNNPIQPEIQIEDRENGMKTLLDTSVISNDLPSPELQVALMEEEPLAGNQSVSSPSVHFFSQRSKKYNGPGIVSPYNSGNPFWGYPAIVPGSNKSSNLNPNQGGESNSLGLSSMGSASSNHHHYQHHQPSFSSSTPRQLHSRRRKRDLIRTLTYLFVLRFLAFHRHLRWKLILIWKEIFKTLKVGGNADGLDGVSSNHHRGEVEMDSRWKAMEEKHRLNRLKSQSLRKGQSFRT